MDFVEEQKNELEALREIYFNEIEVLSDEPPISFSIRIRTQAYSEPPRENSDGEDDDDDEDEEDDEDYNQDGDDEGYITIKFDLPPKYPEEKPKISILASDLDEIDLKHLEDDLDRRAEESLGMVMILTLVSGIDEWFSIKTEEDEPIEQPKVAPEEQRVFDGTPVTMESFLAWKRKFDSEMCPKPAEIKSDGRLTGRAMFECDKTLAESDLNFVEDLDQTDIEALMQELSHEDGDVNDDDLDDVEYRDSDEEDDDDEDDC